MTVLYETKDPLYQVQFLSSVFLNGVITSQCLMYWNNSIGGMKRLNGEEGKIQEKKIIQQKYKKVQGSNENGEGPVENLDEEDQLELSIDLEESRLTKEAKKRKPVS